MSEYKLFCWTLDDFVSESGGVLGIDHILARTGSIGLSLTAQPHEIVVSGENDAGQPLANAVLSNQPIIDAGFDAGDKIVPMATLHFGKNGLNPMVMGQFDGPGHDGTEQFLFSVSSIKNGQVFDLADVSIRSEISVRASFCRGTLIETPHGALPIEQLEIGDEIIGRNDSIQMISNLKRTRHSGLELALNPTLAPLRIRAGALTGGRPGQDLLVSQEHRLVVDDWRATYLFGEDEILVPAKSLLNNRSVVIEDHRAGVEYFDIALEGDGLVCANGLWAETSECSDAMETDPASDVAHVCRSAMAAIPHQSGIALIA